MKSIVLSGVAALLVVSAANVARAQTALQPGLWEVSEKTTMEGVQPMPATSRRVCLKGADANLEYLLYPPPAEMTKHGCKISPAPKQAGIFKATTTCPATDTTPAVTSEADISYKPDSYQGAGQLMLKDKAGTTLKGSTILSGKRSGDC